MELGGLLGRRPVVAALALAAEAGGLVGGDGLDEVGDEEVAWDEEVEAEAEEDVLLAEVVAADADEDAVLGVLAGGWRLTEGWQALANLFNVFDHEADVRGNWTGSARWSLDASEGTH